MYDFLLHSLHRFRLISLIVFLKLQPELQSTSSTQVVSVSDIPVMPIQIEVECLKSYGWFSSALSYSRFVSPSIVAEHFHTLPYMSNECSFLYKATRRQSNNVDRDTRWTTPCACHRDILSTCMLLDVGKEPNLAYFLLILHISVQPYRPCHYLSVACAFQDEPLKEHMSKAEVECLWSAINIKMTFHI